MKPEHFPALYRSADLLSSKAQRHFMLGLIMHLGALVIGAALSVGWIAHWSVAAAQLVVLLTALMCSIYLFTQRPERLWYAGRAVAESVKTITWRYVSVAEPFFCSDDVARAEFRNVLKAIVEQNREVCRALTEHLNEAQITQKMNEIRALPLESRKHLYRADRIGDQQGWYASKARFNRRRADLFFYALIAANALGVAFAIFRIRYVEVSFWPTDVFVAIAASMLSWMQAKRYSELAASYALTAHEISFISDEIDNVEGDEAFSKFVGDAENAFSREHTQWIARKDV